MKKNRCKCGNLKWTDSKTCIICYKILVKDPKNNNNYKNGKVLKRLICHCGGKKTFYAKECMKCSKKNIKYKKKVSRSVKKLWKNLEYREKILKSMKGCHIGAIIPKEVRSKMSLKAGGNGIPYDYSEYGSEFDSSLKEQVRFREGYKCRECGCPQVENKRLLDIHHIDYNKKNNILSNLIALCHKCHMKTNYKREYWKEYFLTGYEKPTIKETKDE